MSFANIQDDGHWLPGGTYTFDWIPEDFTEPAEVGDRYWGYKLLTDGCGYWSGRGVGEPPQDIDVLRFVDTPPGISNLGEILFNTDSEVEPLPDPGAVINDLVDAGLAVVTDIEDVNEDGSLYRFTVQLSDDIPAGTYYLKAADYDYIASPE